MVFGARVVGRTSWQQRGGPLALALLMLGAVACSAVVKNGEHRVYSVPKFGRQNPNIEVIAIRNGGVSSERPPR